MQITHLGPVHLNCSICGEEVNAATQMPVYGNLFLHHKNGEEYPHPVHALCIHKFPDMNEFINKCWEPNDANPRPC